MTCVYSAGAIISLAQIHGFTSPDIVIAGSGSAGTAAYYISGQYDGIKRIWTELLSTKNFISFLRASKMINIDYLIDIIFKRLEPLKIESVKESPVVFYIPTINIDTGKIEYFSNRDKYDLFEVMRAAKAMPIVYNKHVSIGNNKYCDSPLSSLAYSHVSKARELGATDIIIIDTHGDNDHSTQKFFDIWALTRESVFRKNYKTLKDSNNKSKQLLLKEHMVVIRPQKKLSVGLLTNNKKLLSKSFNQGYDECASNKNIKIFLKEIGN